MMNVRISRNSYVRTGRTVYPVGSIRELRELAGMTYGVEKVRPAHRVEVMDEDTGEFRFEYREEEGNMLRRDSDLKIVSGLALVSDNYSIGTIDQMEAILDPFVAEGFASPDGAWTSADGRHEMLSVRLNIDFDDRREFHLNLRNTHGGGSAFVGEVSGTELVCSNGMRRPFHKAGFRVRHTSRMGDRLREFAHGRWEDANKVIREFATNMNLLESKTCDVPATVDALLHIRRDPADGSLVDPNGKEISTRLVNRRDKLIDAARTSPGTSGRTLADVYHGMTWYLTHSMDGHKSPERAFESSIMGSRATAEAEAWDRLLAMAN